TVQYPWQENQQATADNSFDVSLLDPRLYSDAVPETSQHVGQQVYDEDTHRADEYYQDQDEEDSADDSTYELSEEEDSTYINKSKFLVLISIADCMVTGTRSHPMWLMKL